MQFTNIAIGSLNWGGPVNTAFTDQAEAISDLEASGATAEDHAMIAWGYDVRGAASSSTLAVGNLYLFKLKVQSSVSSVSPAFYVNTAGVTLTAGQNFVALYDAAGTRVAVTADQTANWGSTGFKAPIWTTPPALTPGFYYVGFLTNGATGITMARDASVDSALTNAGLTPALYRWSNGGTGLTGLTATPASVTMSDRGGSAPTFWVGLL